MGAAAATVVAATARVAGDATGASQAEALAVRLRRLAEEDADALVAARAAFPETEPETSDPRRDFAFARVLDRAAAAPLAIAEACADVAILARSLADQVDPALGPDLEAAARLASGAAKAAAHLVEVNLAVGEDDERVRRARRAADIA
ncbi:MAG TPA: cyclodeaminase/cyclohydrolase family protein [Gaiellaceae bacterium]|nr:cyclodeaminase/cyclohydrolase family protein [Gaiellaceae bacterium]